MYSLCVFVLDGEADAGGDVHCSDHMFRFHFYWSSVHLLAGNSPSNRHIMLEHVRSESV